MKYRNVPLLKLNQIHFQVDESIHLQSHQGDHNHMNAIPVHSKIIFKILSQYALMAKCITESYQPFKDT